jgi:hypothetical protein
LNVGQRYLKILSLARGHGSLIFGALPIVCTLFEDAYKIEEIPKLWRIQMRILLTATEGYTLSETAKVIYSPGYEREGFKPEHQCLCQMIDLIEARLTHEGVTVIARRYNDQKFAEFPFDKARHAQGCDVAVMISLNTSQNPNAQFSTNVVHMIQDQNTRSLFEGMMFSFGRYMPQVQSRYPNQMKKIPFLETCKRKGTPAIICMPFFLTDRNLTEELLGQYIESAAKAISEALLAYNPKGAVDE